MKRNYVEEIKANLERAEESIEAAGRLFQDGHYDIVASRCYYAAFYAATALLLHEGFQFKKHSGVIAAIHQKFVKTGKLSKELGKDLNWLFGLRDIGDYGVTKHVPQKDAEKAIQVAEAFLQTIRQVIGTI